MLSHIFTGIVAVPGPARNSAIRDDLVEGDHEGEQRTGQHARPDDRQGDAEEDGPGPGAERARRALQRVEG